MKRPLLAAVLAGPLLAGCGEDLTPEYGSFHCRVSNVNLGQCLEGNDIRGNEHKAVAELIFAGEYRYRTYEKGDQCFVEYKVDTGRKVKTFSCLIPEN